MMPNMLLHLFCILMAFILDAWIGDPYGFPHPVRYMGRYIRRFEKAFYIKVANKKRLGFFLLVTTPLISFALVTLLLWGAYQIHLYLYIVLNILLMWTCIAHKCLGDEALKVLRRYEKEGLPGAREQIGYLVARQTDQLTEKEICKATVETVAENTSDGIIGPLLYMFIGGAPLAMAYKAISTLDSTVGYKNDKYKDYGFFSAKADDVVNYIPARITAILMVLSAYLLKLDGPKSYAILKRDCRNHASPNAGYPESATAGALGIQLGGPSVYFGKVVEKPTLGDATRDIQWQDIKKSTQIMSISSILFLVIAVIFSIMVAFIL